MLNVVSQSSLTLTGSEQTVGSAQTEARTYALLLDLNAVVDGDVTNGSVMAGQIAGLVSKEESCEDILKDIYYGAAKVIKEEASRWASVGE